MPSFYTADDEDVDDEGEEDSDEPDENKGKAAADDLRKTNGESILTTLAETLYRTMLS